MKSTKVEAFKEKPNLETAEQYLAAGNYYWNAGISVWNIDIISKAIRTFQQTLPAEFGWSNLGSWSSLRTLLPLDEAGNAKVGKDIRLYECKNSVVHAADESKVVVQGLDGYIVAEKNGQLLVCELKEE